MLKIFTSYTPGAGKSYAMLEKAMAEQAKGKKVLIGFLNGGHRNIELIKEKNHIDSAIYNGKGFSYKQILEEKPDIVVLDEMGMRSKNHGYIYEGDLGLKNREAFRYEGKEHLRTHHLYVCPQDSKELKRHLAFRNYLRKHPNTVKEYGKIKKEAANLYPNDIEKYCMYKSQIIEKIYKEICL